MSGCLRRIAWQTAVVRSSKFRPSKPSIFQDSSLRELNGMIRKYPYSVLGVIHVPF